MIFLAASTSTHNILGNIDGQWGITAVIVHMCTLVAIPHDIGVAWSVCYEIEALNSSEFFVFRCCSGVGLFKGMMLPYTWSHNPLYRQTNSYN